MILNYNEIKKAVQSGEIFISPFREENLQPASHDLTLYDKYLQFCPPKLGHIIDPKEDQSDHYEVMALRWEDDDKGNPCSYVYLEPGEFVLASTDEIIGVPNGMVAQLSGKSSLARLGLMIHVTAGFIDPGWKGRLTLELSNVTKCPIKLYTGMKIGHISFLRCELSSKVYGDPELGSKYRGATGPGTSQMHLNYNE